MSQLQNVKVYARLQNVCPLFVLFNGLQNIDAEIKLFNRTQAIKAQEKRGGRYKAPPKFSDIFNK